MITLDTSGLFALLNRADPDHIAALAVLDREAPPLLVPAGILGEVGDLVERRLGHRVLDRLLADLEEGAFTLDCGDADMARVRALAERYQDLPLGFADAAVVACAERSGGRVLTLDRRDFDVVARDVALTVLPA